MDRPSVQRQEMPWLREVNPIIDWRTGHINVPANIRVLSADDFNTEREEEAVFTYYTAMESSKDPRVLPMRYRQFDDVFSEKEGTKLPPHRPGLENPRAKSVMYHVGSKDRFESLTKLITSHNNIRTPRWPS